MRGSFGHIRDHPRLEHWRGTIVSRRPASCTHGDGERLDGGVEAVGGEQQAMIGTGHSPLRPYIT
jgi:hypothetical protein